MRVLITGGRGQLASDLVLTLRHHDVFAPGHGELDVSQPACVAEAMSHLQPDVVINTAAFHMVDRCESEPESSFLMNAAVPQRLAALCREAGTLLVHISTDYVFDGQKQHPYREQDPIAPLSVYGASKAAGEMAVRCTLENHLIIRTTGLYGHAGERSARGNFVETMLRAAEGGTRLAVVADQVLTPTYTRDCADAIAALIDRGTTGTAHVTNGGQCSWYEFAETIFSIAGVDADLQPIGQAQRPAPARRPAYSVLAHEALESAGVAPLRHWRDALAAYLHGKAESAGTA